MKFVNTVGINIYCEVCKNWLLQKYLVPNQLLRRAGSFVMPRKSTYSVLHTFLGGREGSELVRGVTPYTCHNEAGDCSSENGTE